METNILLETGTNELEILEFTVGNRSYGINVAKVVEIIPYKEPTLVPNAHPSVEGIYMPRHDIITVINLAKSLNIDNSNNKENMYIITNFNQLKVGFHVSSILGIHRVSWSDIAKPDKTLDGNGSGVATGIVKLGDRLIIILDFEKIVSDISPKSGLQLSDIDNLDKRKRNDTPILIAEDSPMLFRILTDCLHKAGYTNIIGTTNGLEAWNKLNEYKKNGQIKEKVECIITDIEMPMMDGHHLITLVKEDPLLKELPVIIFSSLVNEDMKRKGESIGASAQISKPEIGYLVETIDRLLDK